MLAEPRQPKRGEGALVVSQNYYLTHMGIDQWVLRPPIKHIYENCLLSGPADASILVFISTAEEITNQEKLLLEAMLSAFNFLYDQVRIVQCFCKYDEELVQTFISKAESLVWIMGEDLNDVKKSWIVTKSLAELLNNPIEKKDVFNMVTTLLPN